VTIDVGDGVLRPLGDVIAEHVGTRRDAMGDRFVERVELRVDLLATPVPPPGWGDGDDRLDGLPGATPSLRRGGPGRRP
jgi:hypothetical protein